MAGNYIPRPDGDFDAWQANFVTYASANAAALGLDPVVDIPPLTAAQTTWSTDYAANTAAQAAAQAARQAKEAARGSLEGVIRPLVTVDTSQRLQHTIAFQDELTPTSRAKPEGVRGAQIWVKIGDPPPTDPNELTYLATDTRTPYVTDFDGVDGNKVAHYMLRWESTRGDVGPWSETASATSGA